MTFSRVIVRPCDSPAIFRGNLTAMQLCGVRLASVPLRGASDGLHFHATAIRSSVTRRRML